MADITITIDDRAVQTLLARAPQQLDYALRGSLEDGRTHFLATMQRYPAPPPNSTYRRTRTYGRSWSGGVVTSISGGWRVIVGSSGVIAPYNRLVGDRTRQARIHQGRWVTAQSAVEQSASQIQRFVDARVRAALGGI